jgi:hypothetical protein
MWPSSYGASGKLKIVIDRDIVSEDGVFYVGGRRDESLESNFAAIADITVIDGVATVVSFSLPKSDLALPDNGRYIGQIYDANGQPREVIIGNPSGWTLDSASGDTLSLQAWAASNRSRSQRLNHTFLTATGVAAYVTGQIAAIVKPLASALVAGMTKLTTAPLSEWNPLAVGDNDRRMSSGVTVYANRFPGSTIAAQINAADAAIALVASSGTIIVEGGGELTHATNPALSLIAPSENRVIKLCAGIYTNTAGWAAPFRLASNTTVIGDGEGTIIKQAAALTSNESAMVFCPVNTYTLGGVNSKTPSKNIHIRNLRIDGTGGTGYTASSAAINLGNTHGFSVEGVLFTNVRGFAVQVGGSAEATGSDPEGLGYYASDGIVDKNRVSGCQSQNLAVINAKRVWLTRNDLLNPNTTNQSLVLIDIEPAEATAVIEDIEISGNIVDARNRTGAGAVNGIQIQGVPLGVVAKRVKVLNNTVIGGENAQFTALTIGISLAGSTIGCRIEGNEVWGAASAGILTYNSSHIYAKISDNYVHNSGNNTTDNYAIALGGLTYSTISDNTAFSNPVVSGTGAIREQAGSDYNTFQDNRSYGDPNHAFTLLTGANSTISFVNAGGNHFQKNLYPTSDGAILGTTGSRWAGMFTTVDAANVYGYSANGTRFRIVIANDGTLSTVAAPAPPPSTPPPDLVAPTLVSATADVDVDAFLVVGTFSEEVAATNFVDGFTITVDGFVCTIISGVLQVDGLTVHWALGTSGFAGMAPASVATLEYDASGDVGDAASNALAAFTESIVISGSGA